jgi:hypothetical protein
LLRAQNAQVDDSAEGYTTEASVEEGKETTDVDTDELDERAIPRELE